MNKIKRNIHGILLLDKPLYASSNAALQRVKHLFGAAKAGHTGSLDPLATGMLPICFGEATKFSQYLLESDKHYRVQMKLGVKTTTGDAEGEVISQRPASHITLEQIEAILSEFTGPIQQIPPMFSAVKHQGKPLYELARQGLEVERKSRTVQIYHLQISSELQDESVSLDVHCSKGTYVRTLVEDIGERLQCGAYVAGLQRTSVTPYQTMPMYSFSDLEAILEQKGMDGLRRLLLPIESSVGSLPGIKISSASSFYLRQGQPIMVPHLPREGLVKIYSDEQFLGVGEVLEDGRIAPRRLKSKVVSRMVSSSTMT